MTDDFEKRASVEGAQRAAKKHRGGDFIIRTEWFEAGAKWARDEMRAEIEDLKSVNDAIEEQAQKNERYLDFEIERLKAEVERANRDIEFQKVAVLQMQTENHAHQAATEKLEAELVKAKGEIETWLARAEINGKRAFELQDELERAKSEFEKCKDLLNFYRDVVTNLNKHISISGGLNSIDTLKKILGDNEELSLLAESYRTLLAEGLELLSMIGSPALCRVDLEWMKKARTALDEVSK